MQNFSKSENFTEKYIPREKMIRPSIKQKLETQKLTSSRLNQKIGQLSYIHQKTSAGQINTKASNKYLTYEKGNTKKLVRVQEMQQDPFMPPQYKAKRVPQGPRSPPEPLMRSPPKKLKQEEIREFKIPPCISAWKNTKGYLIPLDVRIEAQKYGKRVPKINDKFKEFTQALYNQEQKTKKYLEEKKKLQAAKQLQELEEQERQLREEVQKTKKEKTKIFQLSSDEENFQNSDDDSNEFNKRELVRKMMKKKVEREFKFKEKNNLNRERDLHEQMALGEKVGDFTVQELQINPKLEEMNAGLESGYYEDTKIYDKPLFKEQVKTNIYSGIQQDNDYGDNIEEFNQIKKKNKITVSAKDQPIQFEKSKPKIKKEQLIIIKFFILINILKCVVNFSKIKFLCRFKIKQLQNLLVNILLMVQIMLMMKIILQVQRINYQKKNIQLSYLKLIPFQWIIGVVQPLYLQDIFLLYLLQVYLFYFLIYVLDKLKNIQESIQQF